MTSCMQLSLVWLLWATLSRPGVLELDQQAVPRSCPYLRAQCCGVSVSLAPAAPRLCSLDTRGLGVGSLRS